MLADVGSGIDDLPSVGFHAAQRTAQIAARIQKDDHAIRARLHARATDQRPGHPALVHREKGLLAIAMVMPLYVVAKHRLVERDGAVDVQNRHLEPRSQCVPCCIPRLTGVPRNRQPGAWTPGRWPSVS